jgi:hypothetical protein
MRTKFSWGLAALPSAVGGCLTVIADGGVAVFVARNRAKARLLFKGEDNDSLILTTPEHFVVDLCSWDVDLIVFSEAQHYDSLSMVPEAADHLLDRDGVLCLILDSPY